MSALIEDAQDFAARTEVEETPPAVDGLPISRGKWHRLGPYFEYRRASGCQCEIRVVGVRCSEVMIVDELLQYQADAFQSLVEFTYRTSPACVQRRGYWSNLWRAILGERG